jgi:prevent-host-death family protein
MTRLTVREAARGFSETLNLVAYGHERFMLVRRGRPLAVLMSVADFEALEHGALKENDT